MHEAAAGQDNQGNLASELKHSGQLLLGAVLQHQQALDNANTQVWSNTIWAAAKLGCVEQGSVLLQRLASQPQVLTAADPQSWSNTIWAAAKLGCVEQGSVLLTRLAGQPQVMQQAQPQGWSTTLWAAAKLGCVEQGSVLLERLARQPQILTAADPQSWSNNLWAAATLYQTAVATRAAVTEKLQEVGHLLFQACASSPTAMEGAKPQAWSNTLWAAAALRWYDQGLFAQGAAALAAMPPAELEPQHISNGLYACAVCAHWDDNVQQQLGRVGECDLSSFTGQALANTLYAWAVLSRVMTTFGAAQQHKGAWSSASQALFQEAVQRNVSSYVEQELGQLYVAQLHCQHLGIPGLPVGAVLEAARAVGWTLAELSTTAGQREVATVLQQLGYTTQLEMKSPDGVMSADVGVTALPDGCPCSIAVEFDGPHHFVADNSSATSSSRSNKTAAAVDRLEGPTRLRNALLQARFPDGVVCIPWKEWVAATKAGQQEEYLRAALAQVAGQQVSCTCWEGCLKVDCPVFPEVEYGCYAGGAVSSSNAGDKVYLMNHWVAATSAVAEALTLGSAAMCWDFILSACRKPLGHPLQQRRQAMRMLVPHAVRTLALSHASKAGMPPATAARDLAEHAARRARSQQGALTTAGYLPGSE
jgi:hypothetical protein